MLIDFDRGIFIKVAVCSVPILLVFLLFLLSLCNLFAIKLLLDVKFFALSARGLPIVDIQLLDGSLFPCLVLLVAPLHFIDGSNFLTSAGCLLDLIIVNSNDKRDRLCYFLLRQLRFLVIYRFYFSFDYSLLISLRWGFCSLGNRLRSLDLFFRIFLLWGDCFLLCFISRHFGGVEYP